MLRNFFRTGAVSLVVFLVLMAGGTAMAERPEAKALIGTPSPIFSLPGSHDRLVNYQKDYYGKHALVLTFVPAAFTPV